MTVGGRQSVTLADGTQAEVVTHSTTVTAENMRRGGEPTTTRVEGYDRGHLLAKVLGGPGDESNVVPQRPWFNRGLYKRFDSYVRYMLEVKGYRAELTYRVYYKPGGKIPIGIAYKGKFYDRNTGKLMRKMEVSFSGIDKEQPVYNWEKPQR